MKAKILGRTDKKRILQELKDRFGFHVNLDYGFLKLGEKIKVICRDFKDVQLEGLKMENLGLTFAEQVDGRLKLTMEGSQMVGPQATKNVWELNSEQMVKWMTGGVLTAEETDLEEGFVILKHDNDFLGCGKLCKGKIWSSIPPHRRIQER